MRASQTIILAFGLVGALTASASPFAIEVVRATGPFGPAAYDDTNSVLGAPAMWFYDPLGTFGGGTTNRRVKLIEPAFNVAPTNTVLITSNLILTFGAGSEVIVRFAQPIADDPAHPYGIDFLVFGNSFYTPNQFINESTDLNNCPLSGGLFAEPLLVSVSPGFTGLPGELANDPETWPWYRYDGPYADTAFPTHAYRWNRATASWTDELMDFTKPVNPTLQTRFTAGLTAADGLDLYDGSGGGTGFDLRESGFAWIQYVRVEGVDPDFSEGEVDAFASVRTMVLGDTLTITPENVQSNTAALHFQKPGMPAENGVSLSFTTISDLARVTTATVTNGNELAALPGSLRAAVELALTPMLGAGPVTFAAELALAIGPNYSGDGSDLLLLEMNGTNWSPRPFSYQATTEQVIATVTNLSVFAAVQFTAPELRLSVQGDTRDIVFVPIATVMHTLERSTNLVHWSNVSSFMASNTLPVVITDPAAPVAQAFYRLRLNLP